MARKILSLAAASLAGLVLSFPAAAQQPNLCGVRGDIVAKLSKDFRESPMAVGMVDNSAVLEVFVSDTGTWTILATRTDGTSCIVSAGEGWESKTLIAGRDA
ncbi:hypothetical protein [Arvimicrobium flavum]|uniref:hypothetical protein n=1 Tax=Arvimicrobium flavum TaxID=3393320 RepID=UPI00237AAF69|nr:hypothetical protein [Mesorhizobium shangrilense]